MNNEDLVDIWKSQDNQSFVFDEAKLIQHVRNEHRLEERRLLWLNWQEIIPALLLFFFFGWCGFIMKSGAWAFFLAALLYLGIAVFLFSSTYRQRVLESAYGDSVKEQLQKAISQVTHRAWLYYNIMWWYLLPGVLGWGVIIYELMPKDGVSTSEMVYIAIAFAFFAWVYRANRSIAIKRYFPRRKQLEKMLQDIERDEETESITLT